MVKVSVILLLVLAMLVGACAEGQTVVEPPVIRYGEDRCAHCGMIISDARFAAGYLYEVGEGRYQSVIFDDIGDMVHYAAEQDGQTIRAWYVHDYASEAWLDALQAHYVVSEEIQSPMGYGVAAFDTVAAAEALAVEKNGGVIDWRALQVHVSSKEQMSHSHEK
jgi:copper chaperone NosL